jgi:hypothetical protein
MKVSNLINQRNARLFVFSNVLFFVLVTLVNQPGFAAPIVSGIHLKAEGLALSDNERNTILQGLVSTINMHRQKTGWNCVQQPHNAAPIRDGDIELAVPTTLVFVVELHPPRRNEAGTMAVALRASAFGERASWGEIEPSILRQDDRALFLRGEAQKVLIEALNNAAPPCRATLKVKLKEKTIIHMAIAYEWNGQAQLTMRDNNTVPDIIIPGTLQWKVRNGSCVGSGTRQAPIQLTGNYFPENKMLSVFNINLESFPVHCRFPGGHGPYNFTHNSSLYGLYSAPAKVGLDGTEKTTRGASTLTSWEIILQLIYPDEQ